MKAGASVNEHHLIPRMYGGIEKYVMHRVCHSKIHSVFTESELAAVYNTFAKLLDHPDIKSFVKWVRKQDPLFNTKHRRSAAHL
ncbi:MAG: HNH endonuclease [Proteobacteria bacterium]|nr:MAG: HNH endonuclease [Pseudomonadota bacterium]